MTSDDDSESTLPDWLPDQDDSRMQVTRDPELSHDLWQVVYEPEEFDSEQEMWEDAIRQIIRMHRDCLAPEQIFRDIVSLLGQGGGVGALRAYHDQQGRDRIYLDTGGDHVLDLGLDEEELMEIREMDREDLRELEKQDLVDILDSL